MPPLASFLIEADGSITDKTVEHYRRRAAGGPAMVIMEAHSVSEEGYVSVHQARIYEDKYIEGLYRIANVIRSEGAVPAAARGHAAGDNYLSNRMLIDLDSFSDRMRQ